MIRHLDALRDDIDAATSELDEIIRSARARARRFGSPEPAEPADAPLSPPRAV